MKHIMRSLALLAITVILASCTVTQQLSFRASSDNQASFDFSAEDFFIAVLEDFSDFIPSSEEQPLMDKAIEDFKISLIRSPSTSHVALQKQGENAWSGSLGFNDLKRLLSDLGAGANQSLISLTSDTLTFHLSMENYEQLVPVIPFLADPNFEAFGPMYNQGLSEADYLEMISFMLGDEGVPAIEGSTITLKIETPRPIKSFSGGTKTGERSYEFSFPLIDFLLLAKPITFTVSW
ncbi:MAG TPA: hypothetical protein PLH14_01285 [Sphaerochaeta sp.]|nr:hypothetical protein [Spirochaetota bacterium]HOE83913.1 hypothetical protein [Sphaerochaeta sp.]HOQ93877.1 hypothetical protein [Sphaerochaeta sp.]HPK46268.1 hypothetical protein [Sphaerochaeta sp.]HPY11146.1 hypothetical protein [Sphaerochaeta sp.]